MKKYIAAALFLLFLGLCYQTLSWKTKLQFKAACCCAPQWMKEQINADLEIFDSHQLDPAQLDLVMSKDDKTYLFVRYQIKNNQLSATTLSYFPVKRILDTRSKMFEKSLKSLLSIVKIPDVDFVVCLEDCVDGADLPAPVFAFAKNSLLREAVILIPDFEALDGNREILKQVEKGIKKYSWEQKLPQVFWRGVTTGGELFTPENFLSFPRSQLISLSLKSPDLIDAKFTALPQCSETSQILKSFSDYFADFLPVADHLKYKYQFLIDGNSCAYSRAYWQLFSKSLIFKVSSPHIQWYYRALVPNEHYVPIAADFHDLIQKIQWAQSHDRECRAISEKARKLAAKNLQKSEVYLYVYHLLNEYAKKQNQRVSL